MISIKGSMLSSPRQLFIRLCGWTQEVTLCTLVKMPMIHVETQLQLFLRLGGWTQGVQIIITVCLHSMMVTLCGTIE